MKTLILLILGLTLTACGTDERRSKPAETVAPAPTPGPYAIRYDRSCVADKQAASQSMGVPLDSALQNLATSQLAEASPATKAPEARCKKLSDGEVSSITIHPGPDEVNETTCEINYDGRGWLETLAEMGYTAC